MGQDDSVPDWPRAREPCGGAQFKTRPDDFLVTEILGFEPSGSGEFALVEVEKRQHNTRDVVRHLARHLDLKPRRISYSGMKDRQSVSRQTFSLHLPGQPSPALPDELAPGIRILGLSRHHRKLRRGSHRANRFRITLRNCRGDRDRLSERLEAIRSGVPNYFGDQRFGHHGGNLDLAMGFYRGRLKLRDRFRLGLVHSTARAWLFNHVLAERVRHRTWDVPIPGDIWMLAASESIFGPEPVSEQLRARCRSGDIDPTGPLWGEGGVSPGPEVQQLEAGIIASFPELANGLQRARARSSRRRLRLRPMGLQWAFEGAHLLLEFELARGQFATAILRELVVPA